ncbi:hypothetical protein [Flavobacterium sp.]|uniref:hypothetical protein n=1 Tax=Flavobacterium sp. TaxID=239 RepID=UPI002630F2FF|nr:hypothetical protein [Flavobacterium sp.]
MTEQQNEKAETPETNATVHTPQKEDHNDAAVVPSEEIEIPTTETISEEPELSEFPEKIEKVAPRKAVSKKEKEKEKAKLKKQKEKQKEKQKAKLKKAKKEAKEKEKRDKNKEKAKKDKAKKKSKK